MSKTTFTAEDIGKSFHTSRKDRTVCLISVDGKDKRYSCSCLVLETNNTVKCTNKCAVAKKEKKKNDTTNAQLEHGCSACTQRFAAWRGAGFPALKPIDSTNFKYSTNDYR